MKNIKKVKLIALVCMATLFCIVSIGHSAKKEVSKKPAPIPIEKGYRAVSIDSNLPTPSLRRIEAGDEVDIITSFMVDSEQGRQRVATTILQRVLVLNVDLDQRYITLMLTPDDAQFLVLAKEEGRIYIAERAKGDKNRLSLQMKSFKNMINRK
ncbi:MAG TPA: RcpC/CpaB family pilus assembly protein [Elusimicrobiales bacterium]|nr:RcpC/CpaB family pilus assembly protein [Elusimicrobiales bacterium]